MATKNEIKALNELLDGKVKLKTIETIEDDNFALPLAGKAVQHLKSSSEPESFLPWFQSKRFLPLVKERLTEISGQNHYYGGATDVRNIANFLAKKLKDEEARAALLEAAGQRIFLSILSPEEQVKVAVEHRLYNALIYVLESQGYNKKVAEVLFELNGEEFNDFPESVIPEAVELVKSKETAKKALNSAQTFGLKLLLLSSLPKLSRKDMLTALRRIKSDEGFTQALEALEKNPNGGAKLVAEIKKAAEGAVPKEGRPSFEAVEKLKSLRSVAARKKANMSDEEFKQFEISLLAYEAPLATKRKALAKALQAEENGEATDPFKVTELEATISAVENRIVVEAQRAFIAQQLDKK